MNRCAAGKPRRAAITLTLIAVAAAAPACQRWAATSGGRAETPTTASAARPNAEPPGRRGTDALQPPFAVEAPVQRVERLPNGLRVIVREQHVGGVAAFRIYIGAGSLNEAEYAGTGISHLLEHVVSGGASASRTEAEIRDALAAIGAQTNAHTTKQYVCYHGETSAEHIGTLIDIIADYVVNCRIDAAEFQREHQVVQRELERSEANPDHRLWRLADETFFLSHPARYPIIGYLEGLKALKHDDLVRFYRRVVVPDNAVAVAVGDFDADVVLDRIRKAMGSWTRRPFEPTVLPPRQPQVSPRAAEQEMDVAGVRTIIEFPSVQLTHPDLYALDILAFILGEGRASRLVADLRDRRNLVQSIDVASYTPAGYDGGRFAVIYQTDPAKSDAARKAVMEHLARVVREKVSAEELARAKRQKISEHVFSLQQCDDVAADLGANALLVGDPDFSARYVRNIQNVTADDVQRVAATYLRPEVVTITTIRPPRKAVAPAPESAAATAARARRPAVIPRVLPNGVRLLFCPVEGHPTVSIQMFMRGGLSVESAADAGISSFMGRMLLKGTSRRSAADIAATLDRMGASITAAAGRNTLYLSARCLAEDFDQTFDLAAECLLEPSFPADEVERMREQVLAELAHMADTPHGEASLYFHKVFFPDSPYQFPMQGTPEVVKRLTADSLRQWHRRYVVANNLVVAVFGGFNPARCGARVAKALERLPASPDLAFPADIPPRKVDAREVYIKPSEKGAAIVYVAYPGMDIYNMRDRFAMELLDTVVSGYHMPGGWLHEELRGKGLVYEVHAFSVEGIRPGYFAAMAVCQPAKVAEVVRIIEAAMDRARREEFKEEQLAPARATVITAKELARETIDGFAFESAVNEALGLGHGFVREELQRLRQVRPEDVGRVARAYLQKPVIVIVTSDPAAAEAVRN